MKHGSFKIICLIIWACITVFSGFGQAFTTNLESMILESFNGDDDAPYVWKAEGSRFITKTDDVTYPILQYVDAWPVAVFGYSRQDDDPPLRSLGINGKFDRKGYNWIDIYPVLADDDEEEPYEIPIPGKIHQLDCWVWSGNMRYYIEVYFRDYVGTIHALKLGDMSFPGWRNLRINIPTALTMSRTTLPSDYRLSFVKFRIWTLPVERVDNFYIYLKQLKILTDTFVQLFDGNDLADPKNVERIWGNN